MHNVFKLLKEVGGRALKDVVPTKDFSLETVIIGRNDDYEPGWAQRLEAVLVYNHAFFVSGRINWRIVFVEWNPPENKPLLSPLLVKKFDFLRAIVVKPHIHAELCESSDMTIMLNFAYNAAVRTSVSDFVLISGADGFLGRDVVSWLTRKGLRKNCLYRATRVDVKEDINFTNPSAEVLEDPENIVRINKSTSPPYTNASGDFILIDRESFHLIRGYDENIRNARLHLDSRCCYTALKHGMGCKLIGHLYHINHGSAFINVGRKGYQGKKYNYMEGIPYRNPEDWGLKNRKWEKIGERIYQVS